MCAKQDGIENLVPRHRPPGIDHGLGSIFPVPSCFINQEAKTGGIGHDMVPSKDFLSTAHRNG